jgi:hypothetical protein
MFTPYFYTPSDCAGFLQETVSPPAANWNAASICCAGFAKGRVQNPVGRKGSSTFKPQQKQ